MTKRQQDNRIRRLDKKWEESIHPFNDVINLFLKHIKLEIRIFTNYMMYRKRPSNRVERYADTFVWWFIIVVIFFALKGFTYWLTGR